MNNSNNSGKVIGALLLGTVVGGALGVLFAPNKGCETRRRIMDTSEDLTDSIQEKFNDFLDEIKDEVSMVTKKANGMMGKCKSNSHSELV